MSHRIAILGAGASGTGAAKLARQAGYEVFVSDKNPVKPEFRAQMELLGIPFESEQHSLDLILKADEVVKSPGIPEKSDVMQAVRGAGIPVTGEIELGYRLAGPCRIIAVTGSNGKTTTTNLIYHILHHAGLPARMAGNVGYSFAEMVAEDLAGGNLSADRIFVLELSSFQLDDTEKFRPEIVILLNITPDHLDRYAYKMENYVESKFRISRNQKRGDLFISNADDPEIRAYLSANPGAVRCKKEMVKSSDIRTAYVRIGREMAFDLSGSRLKGPHNMFNAACAIRTALHFNVAPEIIAEAIYSFNPPPHRLEKIAEKHGITYINDSKATNVDSVFYALKAMDHPTVWIVGGQDKGNDYSPLLPFVQKTVRAIVCMGVDNSKILAVFGPLGKPIVETRSAEEAVREATRLAEPGDTVLLSPACASFDLFNNYEHRGEMFRKAVESIK